jgi:hypothetical protein
LLKSSTSLTQLASVLLRWGFDKNNPGQWTRSLSLRLGAALPAATVTILLLAMPNLRSYLVEGSWITGTELSLLRTQYSRHLFELSILSTSAYAADPGNTYPCRLSLYETLAFLKEFSELRLLTLRVYARDQDMLTVPPKAITLDFPSLEFLDFRTKSHQSFATLAWCRFPNIRCFAVYVLAGQNDVDLDSLKSFLFNHPTIPAVTLSLPIPWLETLFSEQLVLASDVTLVIGNDGALPLQSALPSLIRTLGLRLEFPGTKLAPFWQFLRDMVDNPCALLEEISIAFSCDVSKASRFTWECGEQSDEHANFVGFLISYAFKLSRHGVCLLDQRGNGVGL